MKLVPPPPTHTTRLQCKRYHETCPKHASFFRNLSLKLYISSHIRQGKLASLMQARVPISRPSLRRSAHSQTIIKAIYKGNRRNLRYSQQLKKAVRPPSQALRSPYGVVHSHCGAIRAPYGPALIVLLMVEGLELLLQFSGFLGCP